MRTLPLAALLLAFGDPRPAEACTCEAPVEAMIPADGASAVPLDVKVLVRANNLRHPLSLRSGESVVELAEPPVGAFISFFELAPTAPLQPDTTYTVHDLDKPVGSFVTGAATLDGTPATPVVEDLRVGMAPLEGGNTCVNGPVDFVDLVVTPDPAAPLYVVTSISRNGQTYEQWLLPEELAEIDGRGGSYCNPFHYLGADSGETCFTIEARGLDGERSAPVERCTTISACAPIEDLYNGLTCEPVVPDSGCRVASGGEAGAWLLLIGLGLALVRRRKVV